MAEDENCTAASIRRELEAADIKYFGLDKNLPFAEMCKEYNEYLKKMLDIHDKCEQLYLRYDELAHHEKAELDLFIAFAYNSLQYIYLKTTEQDETRIKKELGRIREAMKRLDSIIKETKKPETSPSTARRMVLRSLAIREPNEDVMPQPEPTELQPPNQE